MSKVSIKYYHVSVALVYALISYLCLTSHPIPKGVKIWFLNFAGADKLVHGILYFTLSITSFFLLYKTKSLQNRQKVILFAIALPVFFGGIVEILQNYLIPGRSGDIFDFMANSTGVFLGWLIFKLLSFRLSSK